MGAAGVGDCNAGRSEERRRSTGVLAVMTTLSSNGVHVALCEAQAEGQRCSAEADAVYGEVGTFGRRATLAACCIECNTPSAN